jgi:hypothetical protein
MSVSRFSKGLSTAPRFSTLHDFLMPDPTLAHVFFDDFDYYLAGDWAVTVVGTTPTAALAAVDGGNLLLTVSAADNDSIQLQKAGAGFLMAAGKKAWFKARFKVSDAIQSDFIVGLNIIDTTLMGAVDGAGNTDGIFFSKDDGDTQLDVQCQKDATTGQTRKANIATVANDTFMTVGWYYDGVSTLSYFVNDVMLGSLVASSACLPDAQLTASFGIMNGEAVAKNMTVDYIFVAKER